jgi:signal transduction histidine kinase
MAPSPHEDSVAYGAQRGRQAVASVRADPALRAPQLADRRALRKLAAADFRDAAQACRPDAAPAHDDTFDVVAATCHDMRTPVAALRATAEVLEDHTVLDPEEIAVQVARLKRGLVWLEELVNNLTSWALKRDGALVLRCDPVDAAECVRGAIAVVEPLLWQRRQEVVTRWHGGGAITDADPERLAQALVNLLMNASAYGPPGEPICVDVRTIAGYVEVAVTDAGEGLHPDEQAHVFDAYVRGHAGNRRKNGLGLGLHIVRELVERQGGTVGVRSEPGQGASFWVRLPAAAQRQAGAYGDLAQAA